MLILDQSNNYSFANTVVKVIDQTYQEATTITEEVPRPDFNILIPTVQPIGLTNQMELYQPGEADAYVASHGKPNPSKYGFGPSIIHAILSRPASKVGVYHVNLRGPSATMANVVLVVKYRIEKDVPYTNDDGEQLYVDENGAVTTEPTDRPIKRDVLHLKYETTSVSGIKKWVTLLSEMDKLTSTSTPDDEGYLTMPVFGVLYRGATSYANNIYFNLVPDLPFEDGNSYYKVNLFDGMQMLQTDAVHSFDYNIYEKYGVDYFIENRFNSEFVTMRWMSSNSYQDFTDLITQHMGTLDEWISGSKPEATYTNVDIFTANGFAITIDEGSLNSATEAAFRFNGGTDGTETPDELYDMFFQNQIITDLYSPLRYRIVYVPDIGYDANTKQSLMTFIKKRFRMASTTLMLGDRTGFATAITEHQTKWFADYPNMRQITAYQSPMRYDEWTRKTMVFPSIYYDVVAMMDHFASTGQYFMPFAGYDARWKDFIDDTMPYSREAADWLQALQNSRINIVMKDFADGAYLADQQMNTTKISDATELNNAFLVSVMCYDLIELIHRNHFKLNEDSHVEALNKLVDEKINEKYKPYSAQMAIQVRRMGTVGKAKSTNKVIVGINMFDIAKFADVEIYITDDVAGVMAQ